jgi:ABC-type branched-subunit amino acid transport system substrate-binding protein
LTRAAPLAAALALLAAGAFSLVAAGCRAPVAPPGEREAYHAALRTLAHDPEAGAEALRDFVATWPKSSLADDAALRLAEARIEAGDDGEAVRRLGWLLRAHPEGDRSDAARVLLAGLQRSRGHTAAAYRTAQGIRLPLLERGRRAEALRLLADLAGEAGDRPAQLRHLARIRAEAESPAEGQRVDAEIETVLGGLSEHELERVAGELGRAVPAGRVRLRQAELAAARSDRAEAERFLESASRLPLSPSDGERLAAFEERLRGGGSLELLPGATLPSAFPDAAQVQGTLGVVLPLSGELQGPGQETLDGILLASGVLDGARAGADGAPPGASPAAGLRLRVRDSGGAPDRAAAAVRELGADPALVAVVGPLTAEEAQAAAADADRLELPILTLTRHEDVALGHPAVFRIGLTPGDEAAPLAEYAARTLGLRRVAILHPQDAYGERMRTLFAQAFEARGGTVVAVASYDAAATDFSAPIRTLIARAGPAPTTTFSDAKAPPPLPGGLEAVFLPDAHRTVGLVAPALAFAGIRGARLLGTSAWNDPGLVVVGREHVEGAVFTGAVVRESESPMLAEFAGRFREGYGRSPDSLSALGFDATLLVLRALLAGHRTRGALRDGLLAAGPLQGVSGATDFASDGNAQRRPYLLGVEGGRIVDLDDLGRPPLLPPAPTTVPAPAADPF